MYNTKYKKFNKKKLIIKQSYLLLTWLAYNNKFVERKCFIMPKKTSRMTFTKSPMAHKTFSQEQVKWEEYKILYCYKISLGSNLNSLVKTKA